MNKYPEKVLREMAREQYRFSNCLSEEKRKHLEQEIDKMVGEMMLGKEAISEDLENRFTYHAPKDGQSEKYETIRFRLKQIAYLINDTCPPSREASLALTKLEEAMFWANAAIARKGA